MTTTTEERQSQSSKEANAGHRLNQDTDQSQKSRNVSLTFNLKILSEGERKDGWLHNDEPQFGAYTGQLKTAPNSSPKEFDAPFWAPQVPPCTQTPCMEFQNPERKYLST